MLRALASILARVGADANENEEQLRQLRSDVAATRRILGIPE